MSATTLEDPVLVAVGKELRRVMRGRLKRAVLFGSRARGSPRPDSDYDIAVFLEPYDGFLPEADRLGPIALMLLDRFGSLVSLKAFPANAYDDRTGLMHDVRSEGIPI
jgi:predicted nucleotidyltransferase